MTKSIEERADEYAESKYPAQWIEFPKDFKQDVNYNRRIFAKELFIEVANQREHEIEALSADNNRLTYELDKSRSDHVKKISELTSDNEKLKSKLEARDAQFMLVVNELREALKKISDYSTLDGEKYNSYQDGWHGVADFAKRELTKADQMLKEMKINKGE